MLKSEPGSTQGEVRSEISNQQWDYCRNNGLKYNTLVVIAGYWVE